MNSSYKKAIDESNIKLIESESMGADEEKLHEMVKYAAKQDKLELIGIITRYHNISPKKILELSHEGSLEGKEHTYNITRLTGTILEEDIPPLNEKKIPKHPNYGITTPQRMEEREALSKLYHTNPKDVKDEEFDKIVLDSVKYNQVDLWKKLFRDSRFKNKLECIKQAILDNNYTVYFILKDKIDSVHYTDLLSSAIRVMNSQHIVYDLIEEPSIENLGPALLTATREGKEDIIYTILRDSRTPAHSIKQASKIDKNIPIYSNKLKGRNPFQRKETIGPH